MPHTDAPRNSGPLSLPNLITFARIAAIPVIAALIVNGDIGWRALALVVFFLAAVSDWLDGYLARRLKVASPLGRMLDPIADKLLVGAMLIVLAWDGSLSSFDLIPALAIMLREIFVAGLREFLGGTSIVVPVTRLAKWKTTVQLLALGIILLERIIPGLRLASDVGLWLAGILTVVTGLQYLRGAWPVLAGREP